MSLNDELQAELKMINNIIYTLALYYIKESTVRDLACVNKLCSVELCWNPHPTQPWCQIHALLELKWVWSCQGVSEQAVACEYCAVSANCPWQEPLHHSSSTAGLLQSPEVTLWESSRRRWAGLYHSYYVDGGPPQHRDQ